MLWTFVLATLGWAAELPGLTPLPVVGLDLDDAELAPFEAIVGDATFVGLGESRHVVGGYLEAKARLVRWLVETQGFRLVAIESPWVWALPAHRYVASGEGTADQALHAIFPAFRDSSTRALFTCLRAWNTAHPDDPVHFVGFDVQDTPRRVEQLLETGDARWRPLARRTLELRPALDAASQQGRRPYSDVRDQGMADTLFAMRALVAPEARTVVLAHNAHLMRQGSEVPRLWTDTGEHLARELGESYVSIGLIASQVDSMGQGWRAHTGRKDLEAALSAATTSPAALLEVSDPVYAERRWSVGQRTLHPGVQYDALLYHRTVRPADVTLPDDAPWVQADAMRFGDVGSFRMLHRAPFDAQTATSLLTMYGDWIETFGYVAEPERGGGRTWRQRFVCEGLEDAELVVRRRRDGWIVALDLDLLGAGRREQGRSSAR